MSATTTDTALKLEKWKKDYYREYVRESQFSKMMGMSPTSVIHVNNELGVGDGHAITIPLVTELTNAAVTGDGTLEGNEEALGNYGHKIEVRCRRNGVVVGKQQRVESSIDLLNAARDMLKYWSMDDLRSRIIRALCSPAISGSGGETVAYASATELQKDNWLSANSDRVIFGKLLSNADTTGGSGSLGTYDHSDSVDTLDNTDDKLTPDLVSLAKRTAKIASPAIRPWRFKDGRESYVMFVHPYAFRDFKNNSTLVNAHSYGAARGESNPLFKDPYLYWDGVYVVEIEEMPTFVNGNTVTCTPNVLCGAQALGLAWGQKPNPIFDEFDYGSKRGVGIEEVSGVDKLFFNNKQHGAVTVYTTAVADA